LAALRPFVAIFTWRAKMGLVSRILESAAYEDVWQYLTLAEVRAIFPSLQLKPQVRAAWQFALQVWNAESPHE
jgi:hypothetical protein